MSLVFERSTNMARITEITVSYGMTESLPDYSNVKPAVTLTATLEPDESPDRVQAELLEQCKRICHEEADTALEFAGKAARYSAEPRYRIIKTRSYVSPDGRRFAQQAVAILPQAVRDIPDGYQTGVFPGPSQNLRYAHACSVAAHNSDGDIQVIDCSDGNLSRLPQLSWEPEPGAQHA
jgi:hypothetical protein